MAFSLFACGDEPAPPKTSAAATRPTASETPSLNAGDRAPPSVDGRLPALATPLRYDLALNLDPEAPSFSGRVRITLRPKAPTRHFVLHGEKIDVKRATWIAEGKKLNAQVTPRMSGREQDELVFTLPEAARSEGILDIAFDAKFGTDLSGAYKSEDAGKKLIFTQFEATSARKAFPCFDEPAFKTPFDVEIRIPSAQTLVALSNMPQKTSPTTDGDATVYKFDTSPPMPTYLVAFAVGDFGFRELPGSKPPIRIVTVKGKEHLADIALEATAAINKKLEGYFGILHPYPKLDVVAVPDFGSGAMENPGLITFREERLLLDKKNSTISSRRGQAETIAHELAHQWFGNFVTAAWWNEIWLNEGMATWMESVVVDAWQPSFGARLESIASIPQVMETDALASARAVREPVKSTDDARDSFDGITYQKGSAILSMLEGYLGVDVFQKGVQLYLKEHAWGTATSEDLFNALESVSQKPVKKIASSFLDKPGVPVIKVTRKCGKRENGLEITARPYRPMGVKSKLDAAWSVPVSLHSSANAKAANGLDTLVDGTGPDKAAKIAFDKCPDWVWPNREQQGYFFVELEDAEWRALVNHARELPVAERVGIIASLWAEVRSGGTKLGFALDLLRAFDRDDNRYVSELVAHVIQEVAEVDLGPAFNKQLVGYARDRLAAKRTRIGTPKTEDATLLARELDEVLVNVGRDPETIKRIGDTAQKWLTARDSVPVEQAYHALVLASRDATAERFDVLKNRLTTAKDPEERITIIRALANFRDPKLVERALDLSLTDAIKLQDARYVFRPMYSHVEAHKTVGDWVMSHWEPLMKRYPGHMSSRFVNVVATAHDEAELARLSAFFEPKLKELPGAARGFAEARESAELAIALRRHLTTQGPSVR